MHKNRIVKRLAALFVASLVVLGLSASPVSAAKSPGVQISEVGQQAFKDLSTCLTSGKSQSLDVFYLVDSSGSLSYTDEKEVRKTVLENSVSQLKNFADQGVKVSFAAALFSDSVKPIQGWMELKSASSFDKAVDVVTRKVNNDNVRGYTDWEEGLKFASDSLSDRSKSNCKMLVWLTDGGINPTGDLNDTLDSLKRLCHPDISSTNLKNKKGKYGIFNEIRKQQISIFGVLYQNDKSSLERFQADYADGSSDYTGEEWLEFEHYLMSYMVPLVEGSGQIEKSDVASEQRMPPGGFLECAPVDEVGFAPAGQPNGAFLRAQDPVSLAFQFLKMQAVLAGGTGNQIVDGKFDVPEGTASFRVLTTSSKWNLVGPDGSDVSAKAGGKTGKNLKVTKSAGVYQLDYRVGDDPALLGQWKFDAPKGDSALYLFSGLTMVLDRDRTSQVVSERPNTLTGQVVRTQEFEDLAVDLDVFDAHNLTLSTSDANGDLVKVDGLEIDLDASGTFKVEGYTPVAGDETATLWLTLELGGKFDPVTSKFEVDVVAKSDIATVQNSVINLTPLEGPEGKATGTILVNGPTSVDSSQYCIDEQAMRTTDAQTAAQKYPRDDKFEWKFTSSAVNTGGLCFEIPRGEEIAIDVAVTNPIQADSHVVSIRGSESTSGAATLSENLQFEFDSGAKSDPFVEWAVIIALLVLGLLLPLGMLYLLNWLTTKFLPLEQMVRAEYPVKVQTGPVAKILDQKGNPITVDANHFKFLPNQPASSSLDLGQKGKAVARLPIIPLAATWFEHQAPQGSRVISIYNGGSKNPNHFTAGKATEISPNHADNWQLVIADSEFAKPEGEQLTGLLVVGSRIGNLPQYQARVTEISSKPGIKRRIDEIRAAIAAENLKPQKATKSPKANRRPGPDDSGLPPMPGGGTPVVPPAPTNGPSIPGVASPNIPGIVPPAGSPTIPGTTAPASPSVPGTSNPSIPGVPMPPTIPGVNLPK